MSKKVILVWFRNDLRTCDNEVLNSAIEKADFVIPVYIFDPRYYQENQYGFQKTGVHRHGFMLHAVAALKHKLQSLGGDLLTYEGYPEEILPQLVQKYDADEVYHHREVAKRETDISELVEESLWKVKRNLKHFIGHTLYHKEDLPFPIKDIPNDFNTFKKKASKESFVRPYLPDIKAVVIPPHLEKNDLPESVDVEVALAQHSEDAAIQLLTQLTQSTDITTLSFAEVSPFLTFGILSPAFTYHFLLNSITPKNKKSIHFLVDHLIWRDYFRFMLKKYPNSYFISRNTATNDAPENLKNWTAANTEFEPVNKLMRKLNATGYLSFKEQELLAMYLVYELKYNWVAGAAWFEQQLIDYAPASTYGFWAHIGNEGTSSKNNKTLEDWEKIKEQILKQEIV
ncbi:deoxyribodipyrimidine photo-lyase [Sphingobacterium sp. Mn56C]|uniref:deoxyribodipyrimidine photo-lyase n=1 Tax=Sphingobacterium sp. Mn56C TaxID=3395261 RepID=UPI003BD19ED0